MRKEVLQQYRDLREEIKDITQKIEKLQKQIEKIEAEGAVVDIVSGGMGGIQHFKVEGFPCSEYSKKKSLLYSRQTTLMFLKSDIAEKLNEVEEFIAQIDDSFIRRIVNYRFIEDLSWNEVASRMGNNTENSVRMAFNRYMERI